MVGQDWNLTESCDVAINALHYSTVNHCEDLQNSHCVLCGYILMCMCVFVCVCMCTYICVCVLSFCLCICPCVYVAQAPVPRGYWFHTLDCVTQIEKIGTLSCSGFNLSGFNCLLIMLQLVRRNYQRDLQYFILPLFSTLGPSTPFLGNILLNVSSS